MVRLFTYRAPGWRPSKVGQSDSLKITQVCLADNHGDTSLKGPSSMASRGIILFTAEFPLVPENRGLIQSSSSIALECTLVYNATGRR